MMSEHSQHKLQHNTSAKIISSFGLMIHLRASSSRLAFKVQICFLYITWVNFLSFHFSLSLYHRSSQFSYHQITVKSCIAIQIQSWIITAIKLLFFSCFWRNNFCWSASVENCSCWDKKEFYFNERGIFPWTFHSSSRSKSKSAAIAKVDSIIMYYTLHNNSIHPSKRNC